jgi:putative OPT family oligopeptide transporter
VIVAFFGGMAVKLLSSGVALMKETVSTAFSMGHSAFKLGADTSAALIGVGFIIEFNGAALVAMGGALAWLVFIPVVSAFQPELATGEAGEIAEQIWHDQVRFIGVGGMIVGGIWSIFTIRRQLLDGIKSVFSGISSTRKDEIPATLIDRDLSRNAVWSLIFLGIILFTGVYFFSLSFTGAIVATVYTLLAVFFFVAISVYIVGLIGSTNQPVSGITICTFLLAGLFLFAARVDGIEAVKTILLISGVVCLAACLSGTAAQNFKTAIAVGGSARALQTGLIIAVVLTSLIAVPLMSFLNSAFVIGSTYLPAPQAGMFSSMSRGLFLEGSTIPWNMVETGMCLGVVLIILGAVLKKAGSSFGISPMAVAVGIYLPFTTTLPILFGGLVHLFVTLKCREEIRLQNAIQKGTVICAGLVAGEAITGTIIAVLIAADIPLPIPLIASDPVKSILSLLALILIPVLVYSSMKKK